MAEDDPIEFTKKLKEKQNATKRETFFTWIAIAKERLYRPKAFSKRFFFE